MKKRILAIISAVMAVFITTSVFSGCNLITKDNERDMAQVVASVNVVKQEDIYKKDMIIAYLNYGYLYVNYYGYTQEKTFNLILDNLISNRILVQSAMKEFEEDQAYSKNDAEKYDVARYLTSDQETEAKYNTYKSVNDLLDGYTEDSNKALKNDTLNEEVRTVPTDAANKTKELTKEDKQAYIEKGFDTDSSTARAEAFNKVVKLFKNNGILGDYDGDLTKTEFFKQTLKNYRESELLTTYENAISKNARAISFEQLSEEFASVLNEQKEMDYSEFTSLVSSASADSPVLFSQYGKFGYVYNLLLSANNYQLEMLSNFKKDNPNYTEADYVEARREILSYTTVKDLRSTWVLSGYDYDVANGKFINDYALAGDDALPFQGEVEWVNKGEYVQEIGTDGVISYYTLNGTEKVYDKDYKPQYAVKSLTSFGLDEFIENINEYVYGASYVNHDVKTASGSVYTRFDASSVPEVEKYSEKVNELLFAFTGDSGILNKYKGYTVSPTNSESYIKTFWEAGKELLGMDDQSYIVVAGDTVGSGSNEYAGYFVMFYSELVDKNNAVFAGKPDDQLLTVYLDSLNIDKGTATSWAEYVSYLLNNWNDLKKAEQQTYIYKFIDSLTSAKVSKTVSESENAIINLNRYGENKKAVTVYEKVYADLLG